MKFIEKKYIYKRNKKNKKKKQKKKPTKTLMLYYNIQN